MQTTATISPSEPPAEAVRALIRRRADGAYLLFQRALDDAFGGQWELIGGGADGQTHDKALPREAHEEGNLLIQRIGGRLLRHEFACGMLVETTYEVTVSNEDQVAVSNEHEGYCWWLPQTPLPGPLSETVEIIFTQRGLL